MSLSFKDSSITGGPLDTGVLKQLAYREEVLSNKQRSVEELQYLNARTGWVKMTSSVNEGGSSVLAKSNILLNGTLSDNGSLRGGINTSGRDTSTAYETYENTGFRPMPGITSLEVETQNIYGTLRQATVNFVCWDVEQLTELDKLFLRPGFTVLIEWGNSISIDKDGNITTEVPDLPFPENTNKQALYEAIAETREDSGYNYDAMFGFIKNFVFNLRTDGGYDCRVDVISIGEIIESIRVIVDPNTTTVDKSEDNESLYNERTAIHKFLNAFKNNTVVEDASTLQAIDPLDPGGVQRDTRLLFNIYDISQNLDQKMKEEVGPFYDKFLQEVEKSGQVFDPVLVAAVGKPFNNEENTTQSFRYISLGNLCVLLNEAFMLKDENSKNILQLNTELGKSTFLTFPTHLALDPYICILPKDLKNDVETLQYALAKLPRINGEINDILNIQVNIDYVISTLDGVINNNTEKDRTLSDFIQNLLSGIQDNLGGINEFDLHSEEEKAPYTYYIVDRRVVPNPSQLKTLRVTGLSNTVRNFRIGSQLSPNLSSIMAIGAQAGRTDVGQDVINVQKWNADLEDRIIRKRQVSTVQDNSDFVRRQNYIKYTEFIANTKNNIDYIFSYSKNNIEGMKSLHRKFMVDFLEYYTKKPGKAFNPPGIIPITLSLTLDGIASFKIGQAFLINEGILPSKYDGEIGFIITGVKNSIENNQWITEIDAQTFIISKIYGQGEVENAEEIGKGFSDVQKRNLV